MTVYMIHIYMHINYLTINGFCIFVCEYYIPSYLLFISARTTQRLALPYCISISMPIAWFCWLAAQVITLINSRMIIPYKPFLQLNKIRTGGCRCSDGDRAGRCRRLADQRPRAWWSALATAPAPRGCVKVAAAWWSGLAAKPALQGDGPPSPGGSLPAVALTPKAMEGS